MTQPPHDRKLVLSGIALTKARNNKYGLRALTEVRDELEALLIDSRYLQGAPFSWLSVSIRYGLKDEQTPHYERVSKKYGDLPLAIEVDTHHLQRASMEEVKKLFERAALLALIHAGRKYGRPVEALERKFAEALAK